MFSLHRLESLLPGILPFLASSLSQITPSICWLFSLVWSWCFYPYPEQCVFLHSGVNAPLKWLRALLCPDSFHGTQRQGSREIYLGSQVKKAMCLPLSLCLSLCSNAVIRVPLVSLPCFPFYNASLFRILSRTSTCLLSAFPTEHTSRRAGTQCYSWHTEYTGWHLWGNTQGPQLPTPTWWAPGLWRQSCRWSASGLTSSRCAFSEALPT